jgi:hypothetical protein
VSKDENGRGSGGGAPYASRMDVKREIVILDVMLCIL